jgi:TetR/AcrR family tetracycline transcriptional repressor
MVTIGVTSGDNCVYLYWGLMSDHNTTHHTQAPATKRRRLDVEEVLELAERIASVEGTQALTLRRIGAELGLHHTALYRAFRGKDELLEAVANRILSRRAQVVEGSDWRETFRARAEYALERYRVHPELAEVIAVQSAATPTLLDMAEGRLEALIQIGLEPVEAARLAQVVEYFVIGFGLYAATLREAERTGATPDAESERRALAALPPQRYPRLVGVASSLPMDPDEIFGMGIDVFLDAIETVRKNPNSKRRRQDQ